MARGLIFPHPTGRLMAGDAGTRGIGVVDAPVPQGRRHFDPEVPRLPAAKNPVRTTRRPVPQSDTGGPGEHPKAFGRTLVKELGKMTPYPRYKGCSGREARAAEDRLWRLFTKNTGLC